MNNVERPKREKNKSTRKRKGREREREKSGRCYETVRAVYESKSPLLKLTRKPVAVGTASSTVTQVFNSTLPIQTSAAHAPFFFPEKIKFVPLKFSIHLSEEGKPRRTRFYCAP